MANENELKQAIAAIKAGDQKTGGQILHDILKVDRENETAWLWMSACVDTDPDRRYCLEQALRINPTNVAAQKGLARLAGPAPATAAPPPTAEPPLTPPTADTAVPPPTPPTAVPPPAQMEPPPSTENAVFSFPAETAEPVQPPADQPPPDMPVFNFGEMEPDQPTPVQASPATPAYTFSQAETPAPPPIQSEPAPVSPPPAPYSQASSVRPAAPPPARRNRTLAVVLIVIAVLCILCVVVGLVANEYFGNILKQFVPQLPYVPGQTYQALWSLLG